MLRTDIEILKFIDEQPGRIVEENELMAFIGENATRRLIGLRADGLIIRNQHWYDSRPTDYRLDAKGEALLAEHEQALEQRRRSIAEAKAEQAEQKAEAKISKYRDWRFEFIKDFIIGIFMLVLGILIEKFFG